MIATMISCSTTNSCCRRKEKGCYVETTYVTPTITPTDLPLNQCCNCRDYTGGTCCGYVTYTVSTSGKEPEEKKQPQAKIIRDGLARLPGNRKKMRWS